MSSGAVYDEMARAAAAEEAAEEAAAAEHADATAAGGGASSSLYVDTSPVSVIEAVPGNEEYDGQKPTSNNNSFARKSSSSSLESFDALAHNAAVRR